MLINKNTNRENAPVFKRVKRIGDMRNFSFSWKKEIDDDNAEVWRLLVASNNHTIAYISLTLDDGFVRINLIEREGAKQEPVFTNIGATLISFACLRSVEEGFDGVAVFTAKSQLIDWYHHKVYAQRIGNSNKWLYLSNKLLI